MAGAAADDSDAGEIAGGSIGTECSRVRHAHAPRSQQWVAGPILRCACKDGFLRVNALRPPTDPVEGEMVAPRRAKSLADVVAAQSLVAGARNPQRAVDRDEMGPWPLLPTRKRLLCIRPCFSICKIYNYSPVTI